MGKKISVILPACNEEGNIRRVILDAIRAIGKMDYEIIVIDNGSTDRTREKAEDLAKVYKNIRVITDSGVRGYGYVLRRGILESSGELIFFTDSDLQYNLQELPDFLEYIKEFDLVIGYRLKRADPLIRKINAWGWGLLVRFIFGLEVRDVDCAFKIFRRDVFTKIRIDSVGAMVNTEILVQAKNYGFKIKEVPISHYPRLRGRQSGAHPQVVIKACWELIKLYRKLQN